MSRALARSGPLVIQPRVGVSNRPTRTRYAERGECASVVFRVNDSVMGTTVLFCEMNSSFSILQQLPLEYLLPAQRGVESIARQRQHREEREERTARVPG